VLVVLVICHMAVDVGSIAVLRRELTALLAGAGAESLGRVAAQPLDVATAEQSAAGRRRAAVALRHWETRLAAAPLRLAVPAHAAQAVPRRVRMTSALAAEALDRLVQRSPAGHSATVLAAVAAVLGLRTGTDTCLLASVSGNRYHPGLGDYVGPLAQDALLSFGLAAATFDALVNQAWTAQLTAYRNSRFDATALWSIIEAVQHRRGQYFGRDWVFNDVGTHLDPGADEAVPAETRLEWTDVDHVPVMLFFRLIGVRPALDLELHFDARYFPPGDVEVLLRGVERLLAAAADTDISLTALADVTGCPPLDRGDGWIRSGSSWVDLAEVRRLLTDATDGAPCAVAAEPDGTITGYVAAAPCTDLRKIHLVCLALLPDRPAAATPTKYVLCDGPPEQTSDLDAWQARPVHAEGDAR
jgi:hypothetical protein